MAHLLHLSHEWDFATYGSCEFNWTDDSGAHSVTFSSGIYRHVTSSADSLTHPGGGLAISNTAHPEFGAALAAAMVVANPAIGITVTWSDATNRYEIDCDNQSVFTATFVSAAELRMKALLGLSANIAAAGVTTGTLAPTFTIEPRAQALTAWTDVRAKAGSTSTRTTSSGDLVTVGPARTPYLARFELAHETDAQTLSEFSTRYCWQQFWNDAGRNGRLCYLVDNDPPVGSDLRWAFKLTNPDFDEATHRREVAALRNRWRVVFEVLVRGRW